jgi:NADP-reducing hydrogenase subunit HndC
MKIKRSMVLVSSDPHSLDKGAEAVYQRFSEELKAFDLSDEISLSKISDMERSDVAPFVIVYPEATVYGPVTPDDVHYLV